MEVDESSFPAETTFAVTEAHRFLDMMRQRVRGVLEGGQSDVIEAVHATAREILASYPPDRYVYVGLGRSPAAIIAVMPTLDGRVSALNMPLSSYRPGPVEPTSILTDLLDGPALTDEQEHMLREHFAEFLGDALGTDRDILLVDYVDGGQSLISLQHYLQRYTQSLGLPTDVHALGIHPGETPAGNAERLRQMQDLGSPRRESRARQLERAHWRDRFHLLRLDQAGPIDPDLGLVLAWAFNLEGFEGLAEYGSYSLLDERPSLFEHHRPRRGISAQEAYEILRELMSDPAYRGPSARANAGTGDGMDLTSD
jgi:hypothetical protein